MPLSIKNRKAETLAAEVAKETGETLTDAVIHALEERLERIRGKRTSPDLVQDILEISKRCASLPNLDKRSPDEILGYDDRTGTFA
ncbi:MAG: type II toxin-antitoxin system VapB family antitoxin [Candidatus Riflebacteria bacterium]|nr:type II toxin-antitoxin system VapB family antitoxin [Candidatus Riflebacteria bacterium]